MTSPGRLAPGAGLLFLPVGVGEVQPQGPGRKEGGLEAPSRAAAEGPCSLESPNPTFQKGTGSQRKRPARPCRERVLLGWLLFLPLNQRKHSHGQSSPPPLDTNSKSQRMRLCYNLAFS